MGATDERGDVAAAFDRAAATYDKMVNLNPGYHRHLQAAADALVEVLPPGRGLTVLDLGCGSGASTDALVNSMGHRGQAFTAVGIDGSAGMLDEARSKPWPTWVSFVQGRAEDLPMLAATLPELSGPPGPHGGAAEGGGSPGFDATSSGVAGVLATHLFGTLADRDGVLRAVWDLLAPGGVLVVQDCSVADSRPARARWNAVTWSTVIPLAKVINHDTGLYRRLWRSALDHDSAEVFAGRMLDAGFVDVEHRTVTGWRRGILHTFRGRKPV